MALARTSADKFVLVGDSAHHCGKVSPDAAPGHHLAKPPTPRLPCSLFQRVHPNLGSFRTFYGAIMPIIENPVVHRTMLDALKTFDQSPNVLDILTHDASLLDVLGFFPRADLIGWEKWASKKEFGPWRFLNDFRKIVLKE
jgi:hypothetical protein